MILTEGARVRLRMMRRGDADELYALLSDEAVMRWLEPPFTREQAERFLQQAGLSNPPLIYAAENTEGEFLGYAIYHDYDEYSRELGWVLKPAFWHKGYADEMTDLLTALARREGKNAVIECVPEQTASAHIARRPSAFWSRRDFPSRRSSMPRRIWRENFSATPSTTTMTSTAGSSAGCSSLPFGTRAMRTK